MTHLLGFRAIILVITIIVKRYVFSSSQPFPPRVIPPQLVQFADFARQFPAAPPLVYSDSEGLATAPVPPRILEWILHSPRRKRKSPRARSPLAKPLPSPTIAPASPMRCPSRTAPFVPPISARSRWTPRNSA